jgi:colicin import membrane protein
VSPLAIEEQAKVTELEADVSTLVQRARALEVRTPQTADTAAGFLRDIAGAKRRSETARKFIVDPLNRHVKAINERFKTAAAPLDEADVIVRGKLLGYQREQEAARAAEQARIDSERAAIEQAAEAQRRQQADEAARLEREAAEAGQARQAELRAAENERAREIAAMSDEQLEAVALGAGGEADARLAEQEMSARMERSQAQERAEAARQQADEAAQREIAAKSSPAIAMASTKPAGVSTRKVWRATVIDAALVPHQYLVVDQAALNAAVRAGEREIPGVRIEQLDELAVRSR